MAKSFADDGAFGATSTGGSFGTPTPQSVDPASAAAAFLPEGGGGGAAPSTPTSGLQEEEQLQDNGNLAPQGGSAPASTGGVPVYSGGVYFDDGGSVPASSSQQTQDPMATIIQKALGSVDTVLQATYQQYGLTQGQGQGQGIQDQAANMPAVPPSQSESGVPPVQPMPGPLPPTSNPFGQRMASNMPTVPGTQSNSGIPPVQPMPGPLPPTSNPFGKRADTGSQGGIDTDENNQESS